MIKINSKTYLIFFAFFVYEKDWIQINPKSTDFKIEENKLK